MQDSLGSLTTRSESSANLPKSYARFREHVGERITAPQLAAEMTRLEAVFGAPKGRTSDLARVMANEWLNALGQFGRRSVHMAVTRLISTAKWWPSISEVFELCEQHEDGWRDALGLKPDPKPAHRLEPYQFARNGRTEAEEIAHRAAQVLSWKRAANFGAADEEANEPPKPASQDMWISDQLKALAAKRGYWRGRDAA